MKNVKNHIKILSALSLASSDTREDTLSSVIISLVHSLGSVKIDELSELIKSEFDFEPYEGELNPLVNKLIDENKIMLIENNLSLTEQEIESIIHQETTILDEDKARFQNFKNFILDELGEKLEVKQIKFLWSIFLEYLYNSFYEYGHDAINTLHPYIRSEKENSGTFEDILQISMSKVKENDNSLVSTFKNIVERFPDFASAKDLDFLNDLAQKTLSFSSLGLEPELLNDTINHDIVNWTLYLDTNVLYSLLDLHSHPENSACIALINLIRDNSEYIKIKLRYSELTYKELGEKKNDFDLLDDKMTNSAISALLKSDDLDDFSRKFYEKLMNDRDSALHPTKVIELSQMTLKNKLIEIGRTGKRLEHLGNEFIQKRMDEYLNFIDKKNEIRKEFYDEKKISYRTIYKSERQVRHDISLREILLDSRSIVKEKELTLNNMQFFAVTLDGLLIEFDRSLTKNFNDTHSFPVFFKPSFLLNKLIKVLPIKTTDYKKAFIKAITTRGFYKDARKSHDILKIVNYLKSQGIDDEKVIYDLISKDIFLEKFRQESKEETFSSGEFIESEINRVFKQKETALEEAERIIKEALSKADAVGQDKEALEIKKEKLEEDLRIYKDSLAKISSRVKILEGKKINDPLQTGLDFNEAQRKDFEEKNTFLEQSLRRSLNIRIEDFRDEKLRKWQRNIWWNLFWVVPIISIGIMLIFYPLDKHTKITSIVLAIICWLLSTVFVVYLYINRYQNEQQKSVKRASFRLPEDILRELDELK